MIYLIRQQGQEGPYPEEVVEGMYQRGQLPAGTLYWKQGMTDWAPVHDLFDTPPPLPEDLPPPLPPEPEPAAASPYAYPQMVEPVRRPRRAFGPRRWVRDVPDMAKATVIMLWVMLGLGLAIAAHDFSVWIQLLGSPDISPAENASMLEVTLTLLRFVCFCVAATCFLFWYYRAHLNIREWGADDMSGTPSMSVLWFFVPFANIYFVYKHTAELWRASGSPRDWQDQTLSRIVPYWWMLWIGSQLVGYAAAQTAMGGPETAQTYQTAYVLMLVAEVARLGAGWFAIQLVRGITDRQKSLLETDA